MNPSQSLQENNYPTFNSVCSYEIVVSNNLQTKNPEEEAVFTSPSPPAKVHARRILATRIKSVGTDVNANFKALSATFLKMIFERKKNVELLKSLRCALSKDQIDLSKIQNRPQPSLNNQQLKKIITDFMEILGSKVTDFQRSQQPQQQQKSVVFETVSHHPLILQIMSVLFRSLLLIYNGIQLAENYTAPVPTEEAYYLICELFDLNCRSIGQFYQFIQEGLFISAYDGKQFVFGYFYPNETELRKAEPILEKSIHDYLMRKQTVEHVRKNFPLEESLESKSSDELPFFKNNTPYFKSNGETPYFNRAESSGNFQRNSSHELIQITVTESQKSNSSPIPPQKTPQIQIMEQSRGTRIEKVFGIISIIESVDEQVSRSMNPNSMSNLDMESPDTMELNPISPTTWSQFTNYHTNRTNIINNDQLHLPKSLSQLSGRRKKGSNQSGSNKASTPPNAFNVQFPIGNGKISDQFIKRVPSQEERVEIELLGLKKSHSNISTNNIQKQSLFNSKPMTKSLNASSNKGRTTPRKKPQQISRFQFELLAKSKKRSRMLNCPCREIKHERNKLVSNNFTVQVKPYIQHIHHDHGTRNFNQNQGPIPLPLAAQMPMATEIPMQMQPIYIPYQNTTFKKRSDIPNPVASPNNYPFMAMNSPFTSPAASNRRSQTFNQPQNMNQKFYTAPIETFGTLNYKEFPGTRKPFQRVFRKKEKYSNHLKFSNELDYDNCRGEKLHSYPVFKKMSDGNHNYNQVPHKTLCEKLKYGSKRDLKQPNYSFKPLKSPKNFPFPQFSCKPPQQSKQKSRIRFVETKGFTVNEKPDKHKVPTLPTEVRFFKERKHSYNFSSPKQTTDDELFNSEKVKLKDKLQSPLQKLQQESLQHEESIKPTQYLKNKPNLK